MEMKPTYHLPPNFSTPPPPIGPFNLGTVMRNFERKEQMRPLNRTAENCLPIPKDEIYPDHKCGFEATRAKLKSGSLGLWAQFIGVEGISAERSDNDTYKFEAVDTEYFLPSPSYISQCLKLSEVQDYLKGTNFKLPVYLITGLKVAKGASVHLERKAQVSANATLGINNPGGTSIQAGPKVQGKLENNTSLHFTESSDIIVGIQCLKLYYKTSWFGGRKKLKGEVYTSGATFVGDDHKQEQEIDNFIVASSENYELPGHIRLSQKYGEQGVEEAWLVPA